MFGAVYGAFVRSSPRIDPGILWPIQGLTEQDQQQKKNVGANGHWDQRLVDTRASHPGRPEEMRCRMPAMPIREPQENHMVLKHFRSDEILLQKYLLGQASAEDQRTIEQRLMVEQDYFDRLLKTEEELTDSYVRGKLTVPDKEAFEKHFLCSPERQRNLEFARALNHYLLAQSQPSTMQLRWYGSRGIR